MSSVITEATIPVSLATLSVSSDVSMDLYLRDEPLGETRLYREAGYPLSPEDLSRLRRRGVKQLYIQAHDRSLYQAHLREIAEDLAAGRDLPIGVCVIAVSEVVRDVLEQDFGRKSASSDEMVDSAQHLGGLTADLVTHDDFAAQDMLRVLHHDYATFTHSANVSFYASMLAAELGFDREEVRQVAVGGLLHDLGKLEIADRILSKPGRLDEEELRIIRQHPILGVRELAHRADLNRGQLMMVYQHHERMDGEGYPVQAVGDEIHPWAKICAVVDVFEAFTSHRPYRSPIPRSRAIELMQRDCGKAFDPEILACWKSIIQSTFSS